MDKKDIIEFFDRRASSWDAELIRNDEVISIILDNGGIKSGVKVLLITFLEACLASIAVFIATHYVLGLDMVFSVVLAALASATAPASTMMTIRQTHAKGDFVDTLLQVVALDDVVGLVAYSIAISIALASMTGNF